MANHFDSAELQALVPLFEQVCDAAGDRDILHHARDEVAAAGILHAITRHDDRKLFDWLMVALSFQGIGDSVATTYMETHGKISASDIGRALAASPSCDKLAGYWTYIGCDYHKGSQTCAEPEHFDRCPLPRHDLRNGRLNQTAYSLYLFFRDVAAGNFVGWLDRRLHEAAAAAHEHRQTALQAALIEPLGHVHGVGSKVLNMALAELLLGVGVERPLWFEAGVGMVAIDSLVHNWLHRTGVLEKLGCGHLYGAQCYGPKGCAAIVTSVSGRIDARTFNPDFPRVFPRFVQKAIWSFCAQGELNECNGNRIDDRQPCDRNECTLFKLCEKRVLTRTKGRFDSI